MSPISLISALSLFLFCDVSSGNQCGVSLERRIDCFPESYPLYENECVKRGCCYVPHKNGNNQDNVPWCFFPMDYSSYILTEYKETEYGYTGLLKLRSNSSYPTGSLPTLRLDIYLETPSRFHFKIYDATKKRYEVPIETPRVTQKTQRPQLYSLKVSPLASFFSLTLKRSTSNVSIFDTSLGPVLFGDQYLQISTILASDNIYGLGERHGPLRPDAYWHRIPFWAADHAPGFPVGGNLYGDHPFYLVLEPDGNSHGVFFLNSNAKEAEIQPNPSITWRSIGGIMDFYIFLGPTPEQVIQQYTETVGHPHMPPMWSLGFHLCRWGYKTSNTTSSYVEKMRNADIPQDVQWNDIDYMDNKLDFTYNKKAFDSLPHLVADLHSYGQHYVMIIDPGISNTQPRGSYPPYDEALDSGLLIKDAIGNFPIEGVVWPGKVSFPDFTNPMAEEYWLRQLQSYHSQIPFDGVWIDMNELSNFQNGSPSQCYRNSSEDYPPYTPKVTGGNLFSKTICPSSRQFNTSHYNVHSLTGLMEMKATSGSLIALRNKRPFVISRSTFPSAGLYGGHWTGDIKSTWEHMRLTIPGILGFNMFGVPLVGADICGFGGDTTEELCIRWSQLGAFYPFSRNHNDIAAVPQAPVDFSERTQKIIKHVLDIRYSLLPYLYTLFHFSNVDGGTVARPLFFEYQQDANTYAIDEQFLWGSALLITPVLTENAKTVRGYFPLGVWYDVYMKWGNKINSQGEFLELPAPLEQIPLHVRGGSIIPGSFSGSVTSMKHPFFILAAADGAGHANGSLFWDDGDSLDTYKNGQFVLVDFHLQSKMLTISLGKGSEDILGTMYLNTVYILGEMHAPSKVEINGVKALFKVGEHGQLIITADMTLQSNINITWF